MTITVHAQSVPPQHAPAMSIGFQPVLLYESTQRFSFTGLASRQAVFFSALAMIEPLALSLAQKFEIERMGRVIDSTSDLAALKSLTKQILEAWQAQRAATDWMMRQQLNGSARAGLDC